MVVTESSPTPVASSQPVSQDAFAKRFQQVKADLQAADPSKRELPFPPVNNAIQLNYGTKQN